VLVEADLGGVAIGRHRTPGEVAALIGLDHHTPARRDRCRDDKHD
jgi:hypothetical protein